MSSDWADLLIRPVSEWTQQLRGPLNEVKWNQTKDAIAEQLHSILEQVPKEIAGLIGAYAERWVAKWASHANIQPREGSDRLCEFRDQAVTFSDNTLLCEHRQRHMLVFSRATLRDMGSKFCLRMLHHQPGALCGCSSIDFGVWDPNANPRLSLGSVWHMFGSEDREPVILTFEVQPEQLVVKRNDTWQRSTWQRLVPLKSPDCQLAIRLGSLVYHELTFLDPFVFPA